MYYGNGQKTRYCSHCGTNSTILPIRYENGEFVCSDCSCGDEFVNHHTDYENNDNNWNY